ncbi:hypothetical protein [Streptomyces sp. NBC_01763]|uniref:hypothetical protein n=1 Tax=Streptomyces sp. NBC_01763 TaxID=2975934 RepID=UPI002DD83FEB|nr:hypothetical protein [Streptomyces sp. NBC_01763]WSC35548.1 hypothetical protein OHA08_08575 [Streptomyces sp. NBC_01763]
MSGTSGGYSVPHETGGDVLPTNFDILPTAQNTWVDTGLSVTLPSAGRYRVEAEARASVAGGGFVTVRLFNVTAAQVIPQTQRLVDQLTGATPTQGDNNTAPCTTWVTAAGPTVIRLEAMRGDPNSDATQAQIVTGQAGQTWMGWERIG